MVSESKREWELVDKVKVGGEREREREREMVTVKRSWHEATGLAIVAFIREKSKLPHSPNPDLI